MLLEALDIVVAQMELVVLFLGAFQPLLELVTGGVILGMGVSPILGNAGSQITSLMGNIVGGGNIGRNMSSGEVAGVADAKGPSDLFEKEVHVEGYSSKHREK